MPNDVAATGKYYGRYYNPASKQLWTADDRQHMGDPVITKSQDPNAREKSDAFPWCGIKSLIDQIEWNFPDRDKAEFTRFLAGKCDGDDVIMILGCLQVDPRKRFTVNEALAQPFLCGNRVFRESSLIVTSGVVNTHDDIKREMVTNSPRRKTTIPRKRPAPPPPPPSVPECDDDIVLM